MTMATFQQALKVLDTEVVVLGGGEPTLHPQFEEMLGLAVLASDNPPLVVTNGSQTSRALTLARLARRGVVYASLSRSEWHLEQPAISPQVVKAFTTKTDPYTSWNSRATTTDLREIRRTSLVVKAGRATSGRDECCCEDLYVDDRGTIWTCGCQQISYGTVMRPKIPDSYWESDNRCSKALNLQAA